MNGVKVVLAGREYEIRPVPIRKAREIRKRLTGPFVEAIETLKNAPEMDLSDLQGVGGILEAVKTVLVDSIDMCVELIFDYSMELRADRTWIEDNATDDEAIRAALEVIKLLYPFGGLTSSLSGLAQLGKSTSLPSANGESGPTSWTKRI